MASFGAKLSSITRLRSMLLAEDRFYGKLLGSSFAGIFAIALLATTFLLIAIHDHHQENLRTQMLEVMGEANRVENDLANLETGHRGFLLTGQASYLDPFEHGRTQIQSRLDALKIAFSAEPKQLERVAEVKRSVDQWLQTIALPSIEKRRHEPTAKLSNNGSTDAVLGRSLMDNARKSLEALESDEQALLNTRTGDEQSASLSSQALVFVPKLESSILEMEKSERGYLLTGDRACVETYKRASGEFYAYHGHLSVLLADSPQQLTVLGKIRAEMERWQREIAVPQFAAKQENKDLTALVASGRDKEIMDGIRVQIGAFEHTETDSYNQAKSHAEFARIAKTTVFAVLCVLAVGVLIVSSGYSFAAYNRQVRKMENTEAQTRSIIATTLDGVITISDQGLVHSMNPAAERMFGVTAKQLTGESVTKIIPQRLFLHDMASLGRGTLMAMGNRQNYYPFPIEISLSEIQVEGKKHFVALIRDVTERKRSEETLKHIGLGVSSTTGEEFVRSLVKQLSKALQTDFSFLVETTTKKNDEENTCTLVIAENGHIRSKMNFKLANTACDEALKKGFRAYPREVRTHFPKDEILKELGAESFVAIPLVDHKGKTVGLMGVIDVKQMDNVQIAESTLQIFAARAAAEIERKRFEEDLNAEKERLAVTLRSIGDGFVATDVEGRVLMINNIAERLTGWKQEQVLGKPLVEVFNVLNERTRKPSQAMIERIMETGSTVGGANHAIVVSREGIERLIETSAAPIRDKTNRKIGTVLVIRDITEKEHLEAERRKAEKLESLGVAAGGIAHDFNNLLTAIIGNLSLSLISLAPGDELYDRLTTAKKASLRAQELAQQLLTFAKGGAPIKKAASISQLINDTVTFSLRGSNVKSEFWLPNDLWPVEIDAGQISQVVNNIAINAEQAMPTGGAVRVRCENFQLAEETAALSPLCVGKYIKITVQDDGIGIPEEYLKKIFDPYFTTKPKGSGLGLATSYSIVKNHEGLITVESKIGVGSTFSIYLPASDKEVAFEQPRQKELARGEGRILVLDDEEAICDILTCALSPLGYEVTTAQEALTAISLYKQALDKGERFDLVISDLTIPGGMGGAEAVKMLLELDPTVKAIVSSGYATDPVMSRFREYGFCACITKPYEIADMCNVVHEVISSSKNEQMIYHDFVQSQLA